MSGNASTSADTRAKLAGPPSFRRGPRQYVAPPVGVQVALPSLPPPIAPPSSSLVLVVLSATGAAAMLGASAVMGGQAVYLALLTLPMLGYSLYGLVAYIREHRCYPVQLEQQRREFRTALEAARQQLEQLRERQRVARLRVHPGWQECLARVQRRDPRLWERTSLDADFLELRAGTGRLPAVYTMGDAHDSPQTHELHLD
jgi:S-DNA-T family DNA segregation ATPase FtsK/SpoIIIE